MKKLVRVGALPVGTKFVTSLTDRAGEVRRHDTSTSAKSKEMGTAVLLDTDAPNPGSKVLHPDVRVIPL